MSEQDDRDELARALFAWDTEDHPEPKPAWEDLNHYQQGVWHSAVDAVIAAGWRKTSGTEWGIAFRERDGSLFVDDDVVSEKDARSQVEWSSVYDFLVRRPVCEWEVVPDGE